MVIIAVEMVKSTGQNSRVAARGFRHQGLKATRITKNLEFQSAA
jgi:hypothetical protein